MVQVHGTHRKMEHLEVDGHSFDKIRPCPNQPLENRRHIHTHMLELTTITVLPPIAETCWEES